MKKYLILAVLVLLVGLPGVLAISGDCQYDTGTQQCVGYCEVGVCVEVEDSICACTAVATVDVDTQAPLVSPIGLFSLAGLLSIAALVVLSRR